MDTATEKTGRPRIACHVLSSLDGRIAGGFMGVGEVCSAQREYGRIQQEYGADAIVYGSVTTGEFAGGRTPKLPTGTVDVPDGDFVVPDCAGPFLVSVDPAGTVGWRTGAFERPGRPTMHVVEALTAEAPVAYRAYLREHGVSYIVAGERALDCEQLVDKLAALFGVRTALVCGGGVVDWTFLQSGLLDEVSIVVAPAVDGGRGEPTSFDESPFVPGATPRGLELDRVERLDGGAVQLVYRTR